jgi:hypothetical protein
LEERMSGAKTVVVVLAIAAFIVATVVAISYPAQAQTPPFDVDCERADFDECVGTRACFQSRNQRTMAARVSIPR